MVAERFRNETARAGRWCAALVFFLLLAAPACARAGGGGDGVVLDAAALAQLEQQAGSAQPREQCYLYSELIHQLTEKAGSEIASGQEREAAATLQHADAVMARMHAVMQTDAKRLKNAEMLMEHASRRLSDMLHVASDTSRAAVQATLQKMNALHTELLAQVFAK